MLIHGFSLVNARLLKAFGTAFYAIMHNNQVLVGINGNIIYFLTFCPNTSTKFREP